MHLNRSIALLLIRLLLGLIVLMQGYGKVFTWGVEEVYKMEFFLPTFHPHIPDWLTYITAYYTSYVELIAGVMLITGFKRDWALYALASVLVIVTFGHGLAEPIWNLSHVMYRALLLVALLLLPSEWDKLSLDHLLNKRKN